MVIVEDIEKKFPNLKSVYIFFHLKPNLFVTINPTEKSLYFELCGDYDSYPRREILHITIQHNNKKYCLRDYQYIFI